MVAARSAEGWRDVAGVPLAALVIGGPQLSLRVDADARAAADRVWLVEALAVLEELAWSRETVTTDDLRTRLQGPPRDARTQLSVVVRRGRAAGWIEATAHTQPSARAAAGGRRVRVWRSRIHDGGVRCPR